MSDVAPSEVLAELLVGELTTQRPMLLLPMPDLPRLDRGARRRAAGLRGVFGGRSP